jgi:hypothetical protein
MFFIWSCDLSFVRLGIIRHDLSNRSKIHLKQGILLSIIIAKVKKANLVANKQF